MGLRIVAGTLGGRRIEAPTGRRTRPTREKVREAWFSALGGAVSGARAADLFAGSGALGLEALSRGAASVDFVESHPRIAEVLRDNIRALDVADRARVIRRGAESFLEGLADDELYDLVLADPPYGEGWPRRLADRLRRRPFARLLCVEHEPGALDDAPGVVWERTYGDSALTFLRPPDPDGGRADETGDEEAT